MDRHGYVGAFDFEERPRLALPEEPRAKRLLKTNFRLVGLIVRGCHAGAMKDMLAEVRQSRDDWKAQAERLALQAPAPIPAVVASRRPWWRRMAGG
jgi:hypothetical protein